MKIYVASAYSEYKRARLVMALLRAYGHRISHDWTIGADKPCDEHEPHVRKQAALDDLRGVQQADVVLILTPDSRLLGCGIWSALAFAIDAGKYVVLTGAQRKRSVFCLLADSHHEHDLDGVEHVVAWARRLDL